MFVWSCCKNVFFQYALLRCVMILLVIKCRTRWCIVRWNLAKEVSAPVETAAPLQLILTNHEENQGSNIQLGTTALFFVLRLVQVFTVMLWNCSNCSFGCQGLLFWFVPCSHLECLILDLPIISFVKQTRAPGARAASGSSQLRFPALGALRAVCWRQLSPLESTELLQPHCRTRKTPVQ